MEMKRRARIWALMLAAGLSMAHPAGAAADMAVVRSWLFAQTNLQTWSADLVQTRRLKTMAQPLVSTGRVWFAAPNQFRWEIGNPAQTIAARSAEEMLVIYPRLKRVERYALGTNDTGNFKDTLALLEAGFPRSEEELKSHFKVTQTSVSNSLAMISLEPKTLAARKMMPRIVVGVSTNDFELRATELHFADGSVMRNDFRNGRVNPEVDRAVFKPAVDAGFTVVEPMRRR